MSWRGIVPTRAEAIAAGASAALFALTFPPFKLLVPAFVCLVPITVHVARSADRGGSARAAARTGMWFMLLGYGLNVYWIAVALALFTKLAFAGYAGALLWLTPFGAGAIALLCAARCHTRWPMALLLPIVWVTLELVLNYLSDLSFPWLPLGLSMSEWPLLAQIADLSGVRGVSFWIAATNGLLADAWLSRAPDVSLAAFARSRPAITRLAAAAALAAAVAGYGAWRMNTTVLAPLARVTVVQPNIPEEDKLRAADKTRYVATASRVTRAEMAGSRSDLIVWPETAVPDFLFRNPGWADSIRALVMETRAPLLFGVLDSTWPIDDSFQYYNAAMLTDSAGNVGGHPSYKKSFLVPIVERVPFFNPAWFAGMNYFGSFGRGIDPSPFPVSFGSAGVLICYESIFPQLSRRYRRQGATLLVNVTNDAWFGRSTAPYQHFAHLPLRAIENRLPVARSANTGISGYIDPLGRVRGASELQVEGAWTYTVERANVLTLYTKLGDWLSVLSAAALAGILAFSFFRRRAGASSGAWIDGAAAE